MAPERDLLSQLKEPGVAVYFVIALAGLAAVLLLQQAQGIGLPSLLLFCVGLLGLLARLRLGPFLFLGVLAASQFSHQALMDGYGWRAQWAQPTVNLLLLLQAGAVLTFLVANYRLLALTSNILPVDHRLKQETEEPLPYYRRPVLKCQRDPQHVNSGELGLLLLSIPLWALVAQLLWMGIALPWNIAQLSLPVGRLLVVLWVVVLLALPVLAGLHYWRLRLLSREEAAMMLQDILWQETRREQRRTNRFLAAERLRRVERGEPI